MAAPNTTYSGGRVAQFGFLYQNSVAACYLFELLHGANGVWRVTCEPRGSVDDLLVERRNRPNRYYQVKSVSDSRGWSVKKLMAEGIVSSFANALGTSLEDCELVLASPLPETLLCKWASL